jgi:hypothetical protein
LLTGFLGGAEAIQIRVSGSGAFLVTLPLLLDYRHGVDLAAGREKCVVCGAADELHFDHDLPVFARRHGEILVFFNC